MALNSTSTVLYLPWARNANPAYPVARWVGYNSALGDASGGAVSLRLILESSTKKSMKTWAIRQVSGGAFGETLSTHQIWQLEGYDEGTISGVPVWTQAEPLIQTPASLGVEGSSALEAGRRLPTSPIYHRSGADLRLTMGMDVNADTIAFFMAAWGWMWGEDAYDTPTGPILPW